MRNYSFLFDSDVLINWLAKEEKLWEAPLKLIKLHEEEMIEKVFGMG